MSLYDLRWQKARAHFLRSHPLCRMCAELGRIEAANTVDHIKPHRGDVGLFWDSNNWQALCASCHSGRKQRLEGNRISPHTSWNASGGSESAGRDDRS